MASRPAADTALLPASDLTRNIVPRALPLAEQYRRVYGARTDLNMIQGAIEHAEVGFMTDLCDLESEMIKLDPHLSSLAAKRIGILSAADWDLTPPEGIDRSELALATRIASTASMCLRAIPFFGERIEDLGWALFDGRGLLEIHWEMNVGGIRMVPTALEWVHPRRLAFGRARDLRVVNPSHARGFNDPGIGVEDYPGKFIPWTPRLFREYPEREGLGPRSLYWAFFKRFDTIKRMALTELIALPWRIVTLDKDAPADAEDVLAAKQQADALGSENTAIFGRGTKMEAVTVAQGASEIFRFSHEQINSEMSKLYVGNTGTTDAVANRAESIVHKSEQEVIHQRDGNAEAARFQHYLIRAFVLANYGANALHLTPKLTIRVQPPRDRKSELDRTKVVLSFGVPIPLASIYESSGHRPPSKDEPFVQLDAAGGVDAMGNATPGTFKVVDPTKPTPDRGGGAGGGGAAQLPGNEPEAKEPGDPGTVDGDGVDGQAKSAEDVVRGLLGMDRGAACCFDGGAGDSGRNAQKASAVYGSPEDLIGKGAKDGVRAATKWTASMLAACDNASTAPQLYKRLAKAAESLDLETFGRAIERRMVHSLALGALDASWEAEHDRVIKPPPFAPSAIKSERRRATLALAADRGFAIDDEEDVVEFARIVSYQLESGVDPGFVLKPFDAALRFFRSKSVVTRRAFDRLAAEAKRRAFTIAGMASKRVLQVAHAELTRSLESGDDLRAFRAKLAERFELAGWSASNPSHVETVFRNGILGAYSSGRDAQMRQPEVLAARPYWQILGVNDARTRPTHQATHGKVLRASDPFWERAPIPWGHNCRDRKVSRSAEVVRRLGLEVVDGTTLRGLPDQGWDGAESMIR